MFGVNKKSWGFSNGLLPKCLIKLRFVMLWLYNTYYIILFLEQFDENLSDHSQNDNDNLINAKKNERQRDGWENTIK